MVACVFSLVLLKLASTGPQLDIILFSYDKAYNKDLSSNI